MSSVDLDNVGVLSLHQLKPVQNFDQEIKIFKPIFCPSISFSYLFIFVHDVKQLSRVNFMKHLFSVITIINQFSNGGKNNTQIVQL